MKKFVKKLHLNDKETLGILTSGAQGEQILLATGYSQMNTCTCLAPPASVC